MQPRQLLIAGLIFAAASLVSSMPHAQDLARPKPVPSVTVSGISSGAYMALQFHVAHSKTVKGSGIVAGGPYFCAQGDVEIALHACMVSPNEINVQELLVEARNAADLGTIDDLRNLQQSRVLVYSGKNDTVVVQGVADKLVEFLNMVVDESNIRSVLNVTSEHCMPTWDFGNQCDYLGTPFIGSCEYDAAYDILNFTIGGVSRATPADANASHLYKFNQTPFFDDVPEAISMANAGYVYIPGRCAVAGAACAIHVAFHGCLQNAATVGMKYVTGAGYNGHAELNNIIIIYPQTIDTDVNPKGCFDWWGYSGLDYACQLGLQISGVKGMVDHFALTQQTTGLLADSVLIFDEAH